MNQQKIGKFIASLRKEKNLTQQELADKLHVTDRAISNWENGRRMPDVSLFKPLCETLGISVNELLNGEKISNKDMGSKSDATIISVFERLKKIKLTYKTILFITILIIIIIISMISIDMSRMSQNEPVVFSKWGFNYIANPSIDDERINRAIREYFIKQDESEYHRKGNKAFVALRNYYTEEKNDEIIAYVWVVKATYYLDANGNPEDDDGSSIPYKVYLKKNNGLFEVIRYEQPRDGGYYSEDLKKMMPRKVYNEITKSHEDGTVERLHYNIDEQVRFYYNK